MFDPWHVFVLGSIISLTIISCISKAMLKLLLGVFSLKGYKNFLKSSLKHRVSETEIFYCTNDFSDLFYEK